MNNNYQDRCSCNASNYSTTPYYNNSYYTTSYPYYSDNQNYYENSQIYDNNTRLIGGPGGFLVPFGLGLLSGPLVFGPRPYPPRPYPPRPFPRPYGPYPYY